MTVTTDPDDPRLGWGIDDAPVSQNEAYLVLLPEDRAKGYVRPFRDAYKHEACGQTTTMAPAIAATFATQPTYYGATYCATCRQHRPVGEFTWLDDGSAVGS